jgi:N-ethylmaleimide reductase
MYHTEYSSPDILTYSEELIANWDFDKASANAAIGSGHADLVSFGSFFIGNPDLVHRLQDDIVLNPSSGETYYQGGAEGYIDYPAAS